MVWCGIEGHDAIVERFRRSLARGRLASSYLFIGPPGIGKRMLAHRLVQGLLCQQRDECELDPCLRCPSCQQVAAGSHPDVDYVARPVGKSVIPIELLIGDREHRSQQGLCHRLALKPASGRRRVAIIDDADWMNQEGANCLLKTLEEPPPKSLVILIGTSLQRQLPTIRSRCQIVRFRPLPPDFVRQFALAAQWCQQGAEALELADLAEGSLDRAREFAEPNLRQFADHLAELWAEPLPETIEMAKQIQTFVDSAGREAPQRRSRLRQLVELMIWRLRREILATAASRTSDAGSPIDRVWRLEVADARLDRCLTALQEIDANANVATLIECWVDDLGQALYRGAPRVTTGGRRPPSRP